MAGTGTCWDGVEGRLPMLPAARTLVFGFVQADVGNGTVVVASAGVGTRRSCGPVGIGRFVGHGRVIARRGGVAQLAGDLCDTAGRVAATAAATARVVRVAEDTAAGEGP